MNVVSSRQQRELGTQVGVGVLVVDVAVFGRVRYPHGSVG
jgi:hypothetical protein